MNSEFRKRAKEIFLANIPTFYIVSVLVYLVSLVADKLSEGSIFLSIAFAIISAVVTIGTSCFYFRAFNKGKPEIQDVYSVFVANENPGNMIKIILLQYVLTVLLLIFAFLIALVGGFFTLLALILRYIFNALLSILPYLYIANPNYPFSYYMKGLSEHILPNIMTYLIFAFVTAFPWRLLAGLLSAVLIFIPLGSILIRILTVGVNAYVSLACAGFIGHIIPDKWYAGTRTF